MRIRREVNAFGELEERELTQIAQWREIRRMKKKGIRGERDGWRYGWWS